MASKIDPCLGVANSTKFGLKASEAKELVDVLRNEQRNVRATAKGDYTIQFRKTAEELTARQKKELAAKRLQRKQQVFKNEALDAKMDAGNNKEATLSRMMVGSAKRGFQALDSIASKQIAMGKLRVGRILSVFGKTNLQLSRPTVSGFYPFGKGLFDDEKFQTALIKELFDGLGKSGNAEARQMAEAVLKEKREMINALQAEGVPIGWLDDHVTTQTHDSAAIGKAGFKTWLKDIKGLLNHERTFLSSDPEKQDDFLEKVYNNIKSGKRNVVELVSEPGVGRKSLSTKISQSRQLHFRDSAAWIEYNKKYGHSNAVQAIVQGVGHLSDSLELIKVFGANPDGTFKRLLERQDFDPGQRTMLRSEYNQVSGAAFEVANPAWHKWTQGIQAIQNLSKLGSAIFSSTTDPIYVAFTQHYHGKNIFSAYYNAFLNIGVGRLLQRGKSKEIEMFARKLGLGFDGVIGSAASRWSGAKDTTEFMQGAVNNFFRLNGLSGWTNFYREGAAYLMASDMADATKLNWDKLAPNYRRLLERYGITDSDWKDIAGLPFEKINGLDVISPTRVFDEIELGNITGDAIPRSRELAEKIQQVLITENEFAVLQPGANERAFMGRFFTGEEGIKSGTPMAMANKLFWQFRSFGLTMLFRQWPRAYEMGLPSFYHLVPMVLMGYVAMAMKDILKGRELKDVVEDPGKIAVASVLQSGFGGIAGDFLFNDYRQYSTSYVDLLAGPSGSSLNDLAEFGATTFDVATGGDPVDAAAAGWRAVKGNIPYANWWASRTLFDYLINYQVQEILNPGSLRRMERRFKQKNNQDYRAGWAPSEIVEYGGGLR
uniref:Uncharacterized protein n=1 Tax=uncultured marine microorganism HF4000_48F7 TaxID=455500 RepID=B3SZU6_9ZZZZ|nr:hypothetical protein ALOHA_HF400048F7ctg1g21 [uncultured marine microorganism HF4000_48F7]